MSKHFWAVSFVYDLYDNFHFYQFSHRATRYNVWLILHNMSNDGYIIRVLLRCMNRLGGTQTFRRVVGSLHVYFSNVRISYHLHQWTRFISFVVLPIQSDNCTRGRIHERIRNSYGASSVFVTRLIHFFTRGAARGTIVTTGFSNWFHLESVVILRRVRGSLSSVSKWGCDVRPLYTSFHHSFFSVFPALSSNVNKLLYVFQSSPATSYPLYTKSAPLVTRGTCTPIKSAPFLHYFGNQWGLRARPILSTGVWSCCVRWIRWCRSTCYRRVPLYIFTFLRGFETTFSFFTQVPSFPTSTSFLHVLE